MGATLGGALFYVVSPQLFPDTPFCCGHKGSLAGHIVVSIIVGAYSCLFAVTPHFHHLTALVAGLIARYILRVGIFLVGCCLGLVREVGWGLGLSSSLSRPSSWWA